jgi:hypothetical protein
VVARDRRMTEKLLKDRLHFNGDKVLQILHEDCEKGRCEETFLHTDLRTDSRRTECKLVKNLSRPDPLKPLARRQHFARDRASCCPRRHLK